MTKTSSGPSRFRWGRLGLLLSLGITVAGGLIWTGVPLPGVPQGRPTPASVTIPGNTRAAASNTASRFDRGGLPTRLVIPRADIDANVTEVGVVLEDNKPVWETAWRSAGHHLDSALPGQAGNMVISGHVSVADGTNIAVFRTLDSVAEGDVIEVYSGDSVYRYAVKKVWVAPPSAVKLLRGDQSATITLITCTRDLKNRLIVTGALIPG